MAAGAVPFEIATSRAVGEALLRAFNLPVEGVVAVALSCEAGGAAVLRVDRVVPAGLLEPVLEALDVFELIPKVSA